jgi:hypothetical protein
MKLRNVSVGCPIGDCSESWVVDLRAVAGPWSQGERVEVGFVCSLPELAEHIAEAHSYDPADLPPGAGVAVHEIVYSEEF